MAVNPLISMGAQAPDIGNTFKNVLTTLQGIESLKQAPMKNRLLQAQTQQAEAQAATGQQEAFDAATKSRVAGIAGMAQEAIPAFENGDMAGARLAVLSRMEQAQRAGLPTDEWQEAMDLLENDPATFLQRGRQAIDLYQRMNPTDTKFQFGSTDTVKDEAGNLFTVVPRNNPTTGATETNLSPVGHSNQPQGQLQRVSSLGLTADEQIDYAGRTAGAEQAAKSAMDVAQKSFEQLGNVRSTIANYDEALSALDEGAVTGPVMSMLPTFRQTSVRLRNVQNSLGLNVISGTTFGALSKDERLFALDTALPTDLSPPELKKWIERKRAAQSKLSDQLEEAASFLGTPGNTIKDYIELKKAQQNSTPTTGWNPDFETKYGFSKEVWELMSPEDQRLFK